MRCWEGFLEEGARERVWGPTQERGGLGAPARGQGRCEDKQRGRPQVLGSGTGPGSPCTCLSLTRGAAGLMVRALWSAECGAGRSLAMGAILPSAAQTQEALRSGASHDTAGLPLPHVAFPVSRKRGVWGARALVPITFPQTDS